MSEDENTNQFNQPSHTDTTSEESLDWESDKEEFSFNRSTSPNYEYIYPAQPPLLSGSEGDNHSNLSLTPRQLSSTNFNFLEIDNLPVLPSLASVGEGSQQDEVFQIGSDTLSPCLLSQQ